MAPMGSEAAGAVLFVVARSLLPAPQPPLRLRLSLMHHGDPGWHCGFGLSLNLMANVNFVRCLKKTLF